MLRFVLIDCGTYYSFYFVAGKNPFEFRLLFRLQITCNLSYWRPAKWNLDKSNLYIQSLMLSLYRIYLNLDGLPKMQTQNFIRPAYLMVYHFLVFNYCLQCWCASPNFFTPGRLRFSPSGICFISHDDSIENWHKNASKMEFFFQSESRKKWGMCFAYLSTELEQCKNIHQISRHK